MLQTRLAMLLVSCVITALTGCANISVPTGASEKKYLDPQSKFIVATNLKAVRYESLNKLLVLDVNQYRLGQLHKVPIYLDLSNELTSYLNYAEAKPLDDFLWEPMQVTDSSIRDAVTEVVINQPNGQQFTVQVRDIGSKYTLRINDGGEKVVLAIKDVVQKFQPDTTYIITCPRCLPDASQLKNYGTSIPATPELNTSLNFKIEAKQLAAIKARVREEQLVEKRNQRALEQAERKRQQQLAAEKRERDARIRTADAERKREAARVMREGDGSADDFVCKKYGFRPNTQAYANCRLQIDVAKREMQQQQAQYMAQQQQFEAAQETARERRQNEFLLGMGLRMMGGQSPAGAYVDQSVGAPMYQPPPPSTRTYSFPNGRMMTCTTNGSVTNCF